MIRMKRLFYTEDEGVIQYGNNKTRHVIQEDKNENETKITIRPIGACEYWTYDKMKKRPEHALEQLAKWSDKEDFIIYGSNKDRPKYQYFNADQRGYHVCDSTIHILEDKTVHKQYKLLDSFQFATLDVYADARAITYVELRTEDKVRGKISEGDLTLPEKVSLSCKERDLIKFLSQLAQKLNCQDIILSGYMEEI